MDRFEERFCKVEKREKDGERIECLETNQILYENT